jgi:hypothetical protein
MGVREAAKSSPEGQDFMSLIAVPGAVARGWRAAPRGLLALLAAGLIALSACSTPSPPASTSLPTPAAKGGPPASPAAASSPAASPAASPSPSPAAR